MLEQEGYNLIGAAIEVYNIQGFGLLEEIYQESLEIELKIRNIEYSSKMQLKTSYKGHTLTKTFIPDLVVYKEIIIELKSVKKLAIEHHAQILNYMKLTNKPVSILINFSNPNELEWKRFILS
jgi:GxxExxY protein